MSKATLDKHEEVAADKASKWAGAYLDEIGKTDLSSLNLIEWKEFRRRMIVGFSDAIREGFQQEEIPY
jgi:hypothetical protein